MKKPLARERLGGRRIPGVEATAGQESDARVFVGASRHADDGVPFVRVWWQ
jgi:hypothetical protein